MPPSRSRAASATTPKTPSTATWPPTSSAWPSPSIIVTSSDDGVKGGPGRSIYAATKAAGRNLVRSWIQELKGRNIRVNAVSPASVETPGLAGLAGNQNPGDFFAAMAAHMPGGRNITPDEVAAAVTFLASDDASGINGIDLQVDAGLAQI